MAVHDLTQSRREQEAAVRGALVDFMERNANAGRTIYAGNSLALWRLMTGREEPRATQLQLPVDDQLTLLEEGGYALFRKVAKGTVEHCNLVTQLRRRPEPVEAPISPRRRQVARIA